MGISLLQSQGGVRVCGKDFKVGGELTEEGSGSGFIYGRGRGGRCS